MIRLMLVDSQSLFLEGMKKAVDDWPDVEVICCVSREVEVLDAYEQANPDVVFMETRLIEGNGIGATNLLMSAHPDACVVILSASEAEDDVLGAIGAGARGYLLKDAPESELHDALLRAMNGESPLSGRIAHQCLRWIREQAALNISCGDIVSNKVYMYGKHSGGIDDSAAETPTGTPGVQRSAHCDSECRSASTLTQRECEILVLLAEGLSNQQIASELFISEKTVKKHLNSVFAKLDVANRSQAAVYAIRAGLC